MSRSRLPIEDRRHLDQRIAKCLIDNSMASNAQIAEQLHAHKNTIQRRRAALMKRHILSPSIRVIDWGAIGFPFRFRIDMKVDPLALRDERLGGGPADCPDLLGPHIKINNQERLAHFIHKNLIQYVEWRIKGGKDEVSKHRLDNFADRLIVDDVTILLGHEADLSMQVRATDHAAVRKFVTSGLRMMRGIASTLTVQEAWSCIEGDL